MATTDLHHLQAGEINRLGQVMVELNIEAVRLISLLQGYLGSVRGQFDIAII